MAVRKLENPADRAKLIEMQSNRLRHASGSPATYENHKMPHRELK